MVTCITFSTNIFLRLSISLCQEHITNLSALIWEAPTHKPLDSVLEPNPVLDGGKRGDQIMLYFWSAWLQPLSPD